MECLVSFIVFVHLLKFSISITLREVLSYKLTNVAECGNKPL